jgi:hypothetical protein
MKRTWPYLGALLPFTTTMSLPVKGLVGDTAEDSPKAMRTKSDRAEEEGKKPSDQQSDKEGNGGTKSDAHAPTHGTQADAGYDVYDDEPDDLDHAARDEGPTKVFNHAHLDGGMYASAHGGSGKGHGGGAPSIGGSKALKSSEANDTGDGHHNSGGPGDPGGDHPADTGYVEPDPADADAMMILLGGTAAGAGDGAKSSGEVTLEIVDYGLFTVGLGSAKYAASGDDGSAADTFAAVQGADVVYVLDFGYDFLNSSYSATYVLALDFEEDQYAQMFGWNDWFVPGPFAEWMTNAEEDVSVNGNLTFLSLTTYVQDDAVAVFGGSSTSLIDVGSSATAWIQSEQASLWLSASVTGIDTFASASGSLIEIDDHFSSVSGVVIGVG